jgi:hypothetical protein
MLKRSGMEGTYLVRRVAILGDPICADNWEMVTGQVEG